MSSPSCPSIFVSKEVSEKVKLLFQTKTGQTTRDGVELILKSDGGAGVGSGEMIDVGKYLQEGLSYLAQSPYETLGIPTGTMDEDLIRKGYKRMALKYHPDKNPATTPLFQAIHSAYEKLSNQSVRQEASSPPPSEPPKSQPPQEPHPSQSSTNEKKSRQQRQEEKEQQQQQKEKFAESQQRTKMKERMKQEAKRKEEEEAAEQKRQEAEAAAAAAAETGREKEMRKAEARAAERRSKTGYGSRHGTQQRDHVQRKERSSTGQNYDSKPSTRSSSTPPSDATATGAAGGSSSAPSIPIPVGLKGEVVDVGTVQLEWLPQSQWDPPPPVVTKYRVELSWREVMIPNPTGYGQIYQPEAQWESGSLMITGDKVMKRNLNPGSVYEFSVRYRIPASIEKRQGPAPVPTPAPATASSGEWCPEITISIPYGRSSKSQNAKRPVSSGSHRTAATSTPTEETRRHVSSSTTPGAGSGTESGTTTGHSPSKPFSRSQPIPSSATATATAAGEGTGEAATASGEKRAASKSPPSSQSTNGLFPQSNIPKYHSHAELFEDDGPEPKQGTGIGDVSGEGGSLYRNSTSCSLYHKHFGSATSLPVEEEEEGDGEEGEAWEEGEGGEGMADDFVIPDVWVDDEQGSDEDEDSPHKHQRQRQRQRMKTKWYQLIPPDSHNGSGRYVHAVYLLKDVCSQTIGYISTANKVLASKRLSDWMFVKTHWHTVKDLQDLAGGGSGSGEGGISQSQQQGDGGSGGKAPWGWVRRCEWNERLGRDHVFFRPIPKSVVSGLRYPTNKLASASEKGQDASGEQEREAAAEWEAEEMNDDEFQEKMTKSFRQMASVPVWYEQQDEHGNPYFYNSKTGESRWEAPEWVEEIDPASGARYFVYLDRQSGAPLKSTWSVPHSFARIVRQQPR